MPSRHSTSRGLAATLLITSAMAEFTHDHFHAPLQKRAPTAEGCYTSTGGMTSQGPWKYQSSAYCSNLCVAQQKPVMALFNKNECYCGDLLPSPNSKTIDANCDQSCTGYPETCGGTAAYSVFITGIDPSVGSAEDSSSVAPVSSATPVTSVAPISSEAATSSIAFSYDPVVVPATSSAPAKPSVITSARTEVEQPTTIINGQQTIVKTLAPAVQTVEAPASDNQAASGGSSPVGIAVGVVVGVLVLAAIIVFAIFYTRRRRRMKNAENGHARADSLNAFVAQGGTLPGIGLANDTRLDPRIMTERRRQSNGSIADNQDYSRRILKVANPSDN